MNPTKRNLKREIEELNAGDSGNWFAVLVDHDHGVKDKISGRVYDSRESVPATVVLNLSKDVVDTWPDQ